MGRERGGERQRDELRFESHDSTNGSSKARLGPAALSTCRPLCSATPGHSRARLCCTLARQRGSGVHSHNGGGRNAMQADSGGWLFSKLLCCKSKRKPGPSSSAAPMLG